MPRDLWYRIVYSQALEQQFGNEIFLKRLSYVISLASGEAFSIQNRSSIDCYPLATSSKRKYADGRYNT